MNRTIALVVVKAALGAGLALGFAAAPHGTAHAEPAPVIEEDSPQWDCRYDATASVVSVPHCPTVHSRSQATTAIPTAGRVRSTSRRLAPRPT